MVEHKKITIRLAEYGQVLATRKLGATVRKNNIVTNIEKSNYIIFDFKEVEIITHSFADECFGKLVYRFNLTRLQSQSHFKNYNGQIEKQIIFCINHNLQIKNNPT